MAKVEEFKCRKCGRALQPTEHEARKCPDCRAWTFKPEASVPQFDESTREALVDEAVAKWIDGPEEIDAFCDWLILETVKRIASHAPDSEPGAIHPHCHGMEFPKKK